MFYSKKSNVVLLALTANIMGCKSSNLQQDLNSETLASSDHSQDSAVLECELSPEQVMFSKMELLFSPKDRKYSVKMTSKGMDRVQIFASDIWFNPPTKNVLVRIDKSLGDILFKEDKTVWDHKMSKNLIFTKSGDRISAFKSDGFVEKAIQGCKELGAQNSPFKMFSEVKSTPINKECRLENKAIKITGSKMFSKPGDFAELKGMGGNPMFRDHLWYPTAYEVEVSGPSDPAPSIAASEKIARTRKILAWGFQDLSTNRTEFFISDDANKLLHDLRLSKSFAMDLNQIGNTNARCQLKDVQINDFDFGGSP